MRAIVYTAHGDTSVIALADLPMAEPGAGEVRVRVAACALNHLDVWVRRGIPGVVLEMPHIPGADVAGTVDAIGAGVSGVAVGDRVLVHPVLSCGRCRACAAGRDNECRKMGLIGEHKRGGLCEALVVPAANVIAAPEEISFTELACIPTTFLTAWQMLVTKAKLQPGESVLILAAGSGVGVAGVQIAKLLGAEVIAAASSDDKLERARALGATHTIRYDSGEWVKEVKRLTQKRGVDVVFEHVGAETWEKSILAVRTGGRIVTCGATTGFAATTDLRHVFFRQISILGSTMGTRGDLMDIISHVGKGRLRAVVDQEISLTREAVVAAHEKLEKRAVFGKIVVLPGA